MEGFTIRIVGDPLEVKRSKRSIFNMLTNKKMKALKFQAPTVARPQEILAWSVDHSWTNWF